MNSRLSQIVPMLITGTISTLCLSIIQINVSNPMILAERFVTGSGWVEIVVLGCYASFIFTKMRDPKAVSKWRLRIWRFFSIVFFTQLVLGLSGIDGMLMTGRLHLPIPAVILAGPIYRGEGFFMPVLFLSTIILVGPAWCSHLCYIGAWDNTAALMKKRANTSGKSFLNWRIGIFIFVVFYSFFSRIFSAPLSLLIFSAALFGIVGIGIMVSLSRRSGKMIHCTVFCPIGLLANLFGKISPFRISIDNSSCSSCFKCSSTCRFEALTKDDIQNRAPGLTCTLCGDCVGSCDQNSIQYKFTPWLSSEKSRTLFLVFIITLHTVFLGVARI